MALSEESERLFAALQRLGIELRHDTLERFRRVNPLAEDLCNWGQKAAAWPGAAPGVTLYDSTTVIGDVVIGEDTWVGPMATLDGSGGLTIGRNCSISSGVQLLTHDTVRWALSGGAEPYDRSPVRVGDCCFLGTYAVVIRGVTIGDRCLVGAGAVVTRDVPDGTIVAGVPARRIGSVVVQDGRVELKYL